MHCLVKSFVLALYLSSVIVFGVGIANFPSEPTVNYSGDPSGHQAFAEERHKEYVNSLVNSAPFKMTMISLGIIILTAGINIIIYRGCNAKSTPHREVILDPVNIRPNTTDQFGH